MAIVYRELKPHEFEQALEIRIKVFVQEQNVPPEEEKDEYDLAAQHFGAFVNGRLAATGRLVVEQETARIGRLAVLKEFRGQGLGSGLVRTILASAQSRGLREFVVAAQLQALEFYLRLGFKPEGAIFPDGGIPHRLMRLKL